MDYDFRAIEEKWQNYWREHKTFAAKNSHEAPKYYVLDMFPYPSGAGLHVGHPLGYIASDIYSRYKRHCGFNVLHPIGYDSFGLPAEQYAIASGQHPKITTEKNTATYRRQLDQIGFSFDWDREVRTSNPDYYRWTQWIFLRLFDAWFNNESQKAEPISNLVRIFEAEGNLKVDAAHDESKQFTAEEWKAKSEAQQQAHLMNYRLTYLADSYVNWCPALGTVLANDEVKDGVSERGGHPVERKKMRQWSMRITAYAQRLLEGLDKIDWSDALKEIQRNWIGRSEGAAVFFDIAEHAEQIEVFTTRPDTIFGATFMVLAPEHELVGKITTDAQKEEVEAYVQVAVNRSERERMTEVKRISGAFTGAYAINPFTQTKIPIWIGDYVLAGYGTGAVMAVPSGDQRDWDFAKHFDLEIIPVIEGQDIAEGAYDDKEGTIINSDFLNGLKAKEAIGVAIKAIEEKGIGSGQINYKLRDAVFSRQRYWGEPVPVYFKDGIATPLTDDQLPLELPDVDKYLPTEDGEPPLARAKGFTTEEGYPYETSTMPSWAGSSWYFIRYMDARNEGAVADREWIDYWQNVDLYVGGAEHATGHLLYARFWTHFMYDIGLIPFDEPFQKLINQGMILGNSRFVYRIKDSNQFVSYGLRKDYETTAIHADVNMVEGTVLDIEAFKNWRPEFADATFILEDGQYHCGSEVEKMSKSKYNVVNPDDIIYRYGADTLRLYEMFLGPLEQAKPWDMDGIEGVHRFLRKFWRLYHDGNNQLAISEEKANKAELKALHKTIKKVTEDIERFSFNTAVSAFMIGVNELSDLKCNKREILESYAVLLSPYAPHICEELWEKMGHSGSIERVSFPEFVAEHLVEDNHTYPVSFNGKMRFNLELSLSLSKEEIEAAVMADERAEKWLEGKAPKRVIVVPKKIVNIVV